jgi:hypothetical protein
VFHFKNSVATLAKNDGRMAAEMISTKKASTFQGFCETHDRELFSSIETVDFTASEEQCFCFGFRTLSHEYHLKRSQKAHIPEIRKVIANAAPQVRHFAEAWLPDYEFGVDLSLDEIGEAKAAWDEVFAAREFNLSERFVVMLDRPPAVMCSGSFAPEFGFDGAALQNFRKRLPKLETITFTLVATQNTGAAIFTWLPRATRVCENFITGLQRVPIHRLADLLIQLTFEQVENTYVAIPWWNALSDVDRQNLIGRMESGTSIGGARDSDCLIDAGWSVTPFKALATVK